MFPLGFNDLFTTYREVDVHGISSRQTWLSERAPRIKEASGFHVDRRLASHNVDPLLVIEIWGARFEGESQVEGTWMDSEH